MFFSLTGVPSLNQSTDGAGSAVTSHITLKSFPFVAYWFSFAFVQVIATENTKVNFSETILMMRL